MSTPRRNEIPIGGIPPSELPVTPGLINQQTGLDWYPPLDERLRSDVIGAAMVGIGAAAIGSAVNRLKGDPVVPGALKGAALASGAFLHGE